MDIMLESLLISFVNNCSSVAFGTQLFCFHEVGKDLEIFPEFAVVKDFLVT